MKDTEGHKFTLLQFSRATDNDFSFPVQDAMDVLQRMYMTGHLIYRKYFFVCGQVIYIIGDIPYIAYLFTQVGCKSGLPWQGM